MKFNLEELKENELHKLEIGEYIYFLDQSGQVIDFIHDPFNKVEQTPYMLNYFTKWLKDTIVAFEYSIIKLENINKSEPYNKVFNDVMHNNTVIYNYHCKIQQLKDIQQIFNLK